MGTSSGEDTEPHSATHFYAADDRRFLSSLRKHATPAFEAYVKMNSAIFGHEGGAIDRQTKELIAIAVAVSSQCPYCIQSHTKNPLDLGASEAAVAEASMVAVAIGAGSAATHGAMAMKLFTDAQQATQRATT